MPLDQREDSELLRAFHRGSREALEEIARRHERALLGLAFGQLRGRRDLACDAVQEMWVRVIRSAGTYDARSSVKTWLCRILLNEISRARSRAARAVEIRQCADRPRQGDATTDDAEFQEQVWRLVARLPEDRQVLIMLAYQAGMTHEQAADVMGIPVGTLKSRLHATLTTLRAGLLETVKL